MHWIRAGVFLFDAESAIVFPRDGKAIGGYHNLTKGFAISSSTAPG